MGDHNSFLLAAMMEELDALKAEPATPQQQPPDSESESSKQIAHLKAQIEALQQEPISSPMPQPPPQQQPPVSESSKQINQLKAQIAALKGSPIPPPQEEMSESKREALRLRTELDALKQGMSLPQQQPPVFESAKKIAHLKAQIVALKGSPVPLPQEEMSESKREALQLRTELAALKEAMKNGGAPTPVPQEEMSESKREALQLRAELKAIKEAMAMNGGSPVPLPQEGMSSSKREALQLRAELAAIKEAMKNGGAPAPVPQEEMSESGREALKLRAELDALKRGATQEEITQSRVKVRGLRDELARLRRVNGPEVDPVPAESKSARELDELRARLKFLEEQDRGASEEDSLRDLIEEQRRLEEISGEFSLEEDPDIVRQKEELKKLEEEMKKSEIAREGRRREIERIEKQANPGKIQEEKEKYQKLKGELIWKQQGLDLCLILDATGSMRSIIEQCQLTLLKIFDEARKIAGGPVRIAFMAYRDYCDAKQFEWMDFQEDGGKLRDCILKVVADGGGDPPEDIAGAFKCVEKFSWKSNTRLIFHAADAPCHGKRYHNISVDDYEHGDPNGYDPEESMKFFARNRIDYYFLKMTRYTDQMCDLFKVAYRDAVGEIGIFRVVDKGAGKDPEQFLPSVIASLHASRFAV